MADFLRKSQHLKSPSISTLLLLRLVTSPQISLVTKEPNIQFHIRFHPFRKAARCPGDWVMSDVDGMVRVALTLGSVQAVGADALWLDAGQDGRNPGLTAAPSSDRNDPAR